MKELGAYLTLVALTLGVFVSFPDSTLIASFVFPLAIGALSGAVLAIPIAGRSYALAGAIVGALSLFSLVCIAGTVLVFVLN